MNKSEAAARGVCIPGFLGVSFALPSRRQVKEHPSNSHNALHPGHGTLDVDSGMPIERFRGICADTYAKSRILSYRQAAPTKNEKCLGNSSSKCKDLGPETPNLLTLSLCFNH